MKLVAITSEHGFARMPSTVALISSHIKRCLCWLRRAPPAWGSASYAFCQYAFGASSLPPRLFLRFHAPCEAAEFSLRSRWGSSFSGAIWPLPQKACSLSPANWFFHFHNKFELRFIRLMRTFIVEKKDMNPQKGIDEDFQYMEGETCPRVFCTTDSVL